MVEEIKLPKLMRVKEAAKLTPFSETVLREAIYAGDLKVVRPRQYRRTYFITEQALQDHYY